MTTLFASLLFALRPHALPSPTTPGVGGRCEDLFFCLSSERGLCVACAYFQASMIALKSAALSEAPPIRPPSMSSLLKSSGALLPLHEPP